MTTTTELPPPPRAPMRPHRKKYHGHEIEDPWAWLRGPGYPEVTNEKVLQDRKKSRCGS